MPQWTDFGAFGLDEARPFRWPRYSSGARHHFCPSDVARKIQMVRAPEVAASLDQLVGAAY
jgi:hypothetical protein